MMASERVTAASSRHVSSLRTLCGSELKKAVKTGDFDFLVECQRKKVNIENFKDENGDTVFHVAARDGNLPVLEFLVDGYAEVDCTNAKGETPLHTALGVQNLDVAYFLVDSGADINKQLAPPQTDPTAPRPVVYTPAVKNEGVVEEDDPLRADEELESELSENDDDDDEEDDDDSSEEEGEEGEESEEDEVERTTVLRLRDSTPLHSAVTDGNESLVTFLVENGADINAQNGLKETPLHLAVLKGNEKIAVYLVTKGARPMHDENGMTPLHIAFKANNVSMMCFLAEQGFDVGIKPTDVAECEETLPKEVLKKCTVATPAKPLPAKKGSGGVFKPAGSAPVKKSTAPVSKPTGPSSKAGSTTTASKTDTADGQRRGLPTPRGLPAKKTTR